MKFSAAHKVASKTFPFQTPGWSLTDGQTATTASSPKSVDLQMTREKTLSQASPKEKFKKQQTTSGKIKKRGKQTQERRGAGLKQALPCLSCGSPSTMMQPNKILPPVEMDTPSRMLGQTPHQLVPGGLCVPMSLETSNSLVGVRQHCHPCADMGRSQNMGDPRKGGGCSLKSLQTTSKTGALSKKETSHPHKKDPVSQACRAHISWRRVQVMSQTANA